VSASSNAVVWQNAMDLINAVVVASRVSSEAPLQVDDHVLSGEKDQNEELQFDLAWVGTEETRARVKRLLQRVLVTCGQDVLVSSNPIVFLQDENDNSYIALSDTDQTLRRAVVAPTLESIAETSERDEVSTYLANFDFLDKELLSDTTSPS
jgi:hypothetical protein